MKILIKGGIVVDPVREQETVADVLVKGGLIAAVGTDLDASGARVVDAVGRLVVPGLIDMHVHLREPGFEAKEDIASGTRAAVRGGFTAVACMPNTNPVADNHSVITYILTKARAAELARVYPIGAVTRGSRGEELAELADMQAAGAVAVSDDGQPVMNAGVMRRAMQYAGMLGLTVISHCEDRDLVAGGVMHEGLISTMLGLKGMPAEAEEVMLARDMILADRTGCRLHIAHISTVGAVRLVREAKSWGVQITAEATPHHFILTDEAVADFNTNTKVNPPLRGAADVEAVREGLADGTIDVIATDHAPHTFEDKDVEYERAPFGLVGLETAVGLVWTELVHTGLLTPAQAVAKMSSNPARILGVPGGTLALGAAADLTIIDPIREEVVDPDRFASKGRNTPFAGRLLRGLPVLTMVAGREVYQAEE